MWSGGVGPDELYTPLCLGGWGMLGLRLTLLFSPFIWGVHLQLRLLSILLVPGAVCGYKQCLSCVLACWFGV